MDLPQPRLPKTPWNLCHLCMAANLSLLVVNYVVAGAVASTFVFGAQITTLVAQVVLTLWCMMHSHSAHKQWCSDMASQTEFLREASHALSMRNERIVELKKESTVQGLKSIVRYGARN